MIGLGRMGGNMALRLIESGHTVVANARTDKSVNRLKAQGAEPAYTLPQLAEKLPSPRVVWLMVPISVVDRVLSHLTPHLESGDLVVDGGNSYYRDTLRRPEQLAAEGLRLIDVGTSGGIWGREEGYCMMVGGESEDVEMIRPFLETLAPGPERGWGHVGAVGSGHFVKMIHNGIEYGLMQAYAEGFSLLHHKDDFDLDLHQIAQIWRHGSVIRSWLLDLTAAALADDADLTDVIPWVEDSGEGRWTVCESIDLDVAAPVITLALQARLRSRDDEAYADRLLAVMREQFGGHEVKREPSED